MKKKESHKEEKKEMMHEKKESHKQEKKEHKKKGK